MNQLLPIHDSESLDIGVGLGGVLLIDIVSRRREGELTMACTL